MERLKKIKKMGIIPVNKSVLYSLFNDLKQPKDKISDLEHKGLIVRIKRDLYVVSKQIHNLEISRELVANHLYGPSYVSLESALAHYALIPERVYAMRSVCMKMHKQYNTPLGQFEYEKVPVQYFQIGINREIVDNSYSFLIASPEKALCDLILCANNLRLQSVKAMSEYLEEDLRFEMSALASFNIDIVEECLAFGRKKMELTQLFKLLSLLSNEK
jgi:hypothetical protein